MASFTVTLADADMTRVQAAFSRLGQPATLTELGVECIDFLSNKTESTERASAISTAIATVTPIDRSVIQI
jgi:hypothetical protein